jgi:hypothetical protein
MQQKTTSLSSFPGPEWFSCVHGNAGLRYATKHNISAMKLCFVAYLRGDGTRGTVSRDQKNSFTGPE